MMIGRAPMVTCLHAVHNSQYMQLMVLILCRDMLVFPLSVYNAVVQTPLTIRSFIVKMLLPSWKHLREARKMQASLLDCIYHCYTAMHSTRLQGLLTST